MPRRSVWIETPRALRRQRGLERDSAQALADWERWMAAVDAYAAREDPAGRADMVLRGDLDLWGA